jgi:hypothetical protein
MSRTSTNMLTAIVSGNTAVTGDKIPGDSYYGFTDGVHTVAIYPNSYTGQVKIQATLAEDPTANDWFEIGLKDGDFAEYNSVSTVDAYTFTGNFLYLRAVVTPQASNSGSVDKILLNY